MTKFLNLNPDLCTGCRICESTCSITNEGVINRVKSRIHIYRRDVLELVQLYCDQCDEHVCLNVCPTGAISIVNNQLRVKRSLCDGCGKCADVCNKIFLSPVNNYALMCNQCAACVKTCPEGALEIKEKECLE
jgi:anaerobic carbon-monoxide dehydrogenase iron sulfur subunit